jgi:hypothetical protein
MSTHHNVIEPVPRNFNHYNFSNPHLSWGCKYQLHCRSGITSDKINCLIGDSFIERLLRPSHLNLFQENFPGWKNLGIGGDKVENIAWRINNGGFPQNPGKVILMCGSNNSFSTSCAPLTKFGEMASSGR